MTEQRRYIRNMQLPGFGPQGQQQLLSSAVLIVGCGALGSLSAMYLAGAGVGRIVLVDYDTVDISNLQRQLSYDENDTGKPKAATLADKLLAINSEIQIEYHNALLRRDLAQQLIGDVDLVLECTDNPDSKYLVTDTAEQLGVPYALGGVAQYSGQVMAWRCGCVSYRQLFPDSASADGYMPCSVGGVLNTLPGIVASIQATEAIKLITGIGTPLTDRLLLIDSLTMQIREICLNT